MTKAEFQADAQRFGRMHAASSQVSRAVIHSRSREELLCEVSRVLVEVGKFSMAYIASYDPATHELIPVARHGNNVFYLERIHVYSDERSEGQGPGGTAFRENKPYICNDFQSDPRTLPWRDAAAASGWRASAAFPICIAGVPSMLLTVYAMEAGVFEAEQVVLLEQAAHDIEFGLDHLAAEEQRRLAESALAASEQRLKLSMDAAQSGAFEADLVAKRMAIDAQSQRLFGFDSGGFDGTLNCIRNRVHPDDLPGLIANMIQARDAHRCFAQQFRVVRPDLGERWLAARGEYHYSESGEADRMYGIVLDVTEWKNAEETLRRNEERYRTILETATDGFWLLDARGRLLEVNESYCRMSGYSEAELLTMSVHDLEATEAADEIAAHMRTIAAQGEHRFETRHRRKDGSTFEVENNVQYWPIEGGRFVVFAHDITDRKRTEAALRQSEERLRQVVRVSNIGILDHDHVTDTLYSSPELRAIHGFGADEAFSLQTFLGLVHPRDQERIKAAVRHTLDPAGDGRFDVEHRLLLRDGSIRWTSTRAQTFFEGEGSARHPVRTVGAVRDITDQKLAQEEQKQLASLVAMSPNFVGRATLEGRIEYLNNAAMELVGIQSLEEARRTNILDFFSESDRPRLAEVVRRCLNDTGYWSGEARFRHFQTGEMIDVQVVGFVVHDEQGVPLYLETVTQDIRERKRSEAEREKLKERLSQAQKMESIGRLAGGIAHDFNNLLTVINGYARLLLGKLPDGDPMRTDLDEIYKAGQRAAGLTEQLLGFSRMQVRQPKLLDFNRVVAGMQPMLERLVGEDVELQVHLHPEVTAIHADPHQMEQVVMNLVVNSRQAMPQGGMLVIETSVVELAESEVRPDAGERPGRFVMLRVTDNGMGMDEETRKHIFEPFFTSKQARVATGLGLSMIQGIVEQTGGHIQFNSELGQGTTFEVYLPNALGTPAEKDPSEAALPLGGHETILVVEDQPEVRRYAAIALQSYGYRVIEAHSAEEALKICERKREPLHMVLTDVVMPNMGGRELADQLRKIRPEIRVLYMSGYTDDAIVRHGLVKGETDLIQKPFDPEPLALKVREMLDTQRRRARIVVADDEDSVRRFLRMVLEEAGYDVLEAADGKQALKAVRAGGVDLLITDLVMPEQEGIETIQALHRDAAHVAIIAMSGAFGGQYLDVAQLLGAEAALSKPVSPEALLATVAKVLKLRP